ncbi:MAG: DASS family sodium-coupled anion symporter [Theionarchaea archaeon]|nr:DASS family sodium-coupled anion symporter [Theionarchaea archaeon]
MSHVIRWKWLIVIAAAAAVAFLLPTPEGLSVLGKRTLIVLIIAAGAFLTDALPVPGVALLIPLLLVVFQIDTPDGVASSMMSDSVLFILGSLMIATVMIKHGVDKRIASFILTRTGTSTFRVSFGIVAACALLSSFMSDHMVAAVMLPVGIAIVESAREERSPSLGKLIMFCIAYGCAIGGMGTPSGGARNAIMLAYLHQLFGIQITYGQWAVAAFPMVLVNIPVTAVVLTRIFKPEVRDLGKALQGLRRKESQIHPMKKEEKISISVFAVIVVLWILVGTRFGLGMIALFGAVLYLLCGVVEWAEYQRGVAWGVVLLYSGAISLGIAMMETGAAHFLAEEFLSLLSSLGVHSGQSFAASVAFLTMMMTQAMSDGAAVAVLGPINLNLAALSGASVVQVGLATACSAAFAYLLVIGTPPNAIVSSSGYVLPRDFLKAGIIQFIASYLILLFFILVVWGILGI